MVDSTNRSSDRSYAIENSPPVEKIAQNKTQPRTNTTVCHGMLAGFREGIDTCPTKVARPSAKGSNLHFGGPAPSGPGAPAPKQTPPAQSNSAEGQAATKLAESEVNQLAERLQTGKPPLPGEAKNALDNLLRNENLKGLKASMRIALLSQIENYRDSKLIVKVIQNLELLAERWSDESKRGERPSLEDQQRFAKVLAFASQYIPDIPENKNTLGYDPNLSRKILDNTLAFILRRDKSGRYRVKVKWDDLNIYGRWIPDEGLVLNRKLVKSGNDKLVGDKAIQIAAYTLPHEVNHALHPVSPNGSYGHLMDEYRAFYVGHVTHVGSPPSQPQAMLYVHSIVSDDRSSALKASFESNGVESRKMVAFIGNKILGLPGKVTLDAINRKLKEPNALSKDRPAPIPESVDGGPNNLDNRFEP
jgi:hypothetical protein